MTILDHATFRGERPHFSFLCVFFFPHEIGQQQKHLSNWEQNIWTTKKTSHRIPINFQASYPEKLTRSRCGTGSVSTGVASVLTSPTASAPTSPGRSPLPSTPCSSIALPKSLFRSCYEPNNQTTARKHLIRPWHFFLARQFLSKHPDILGFIRSIFALYLRENMNTEKGGIGLQHRTKFTKIPPKI